VTKSHLITTQKTKEKDMKKLTLLSLVAIILMASILGCNAFRGAGKDMSDTGQHLQDVGK